ncbi:MAG: phage tail tape measure protein [Comamonadaceae bacterium]|nr:phage tail tape measure protein [Comamonadaceae bacterium]
MSKLSAEQRNAALATIFGSDAVRAAAVLYDQGADGIAKWTRDVNDSGFAADQAARLTDNLSGDLERLGGSLDTALIKSGSGANDALRGLSQGLESAVNWFSRLPAPVQTGAVQVGAASAAVLLLGGVVLTAIPKIQAFKVAMADMGLTAQLSSSRVATAAKSIGILTAAAAGLSVAYAGMQGVVNDWAGANDDAVKSLDALLKGGTRAEGVTMLMRDGFNDLGASVERVFNESLWIRGTNLLDGIMFLDGSNAGSSIAFFQQLDKALSGFVSSGKADQAAEMFKRVTDEASRQGIPLARLQEAFPQYAAALEQAKIAQDGMRESTSPTVVAVEDYLAAATSATEATKAYADALKGFASPVLDAREANRKWEESIASSEAALASNGKTLADGTEKGRENARALDGMTTAALDNIGAMQANGASQATLQATLDTSRQRIEAMAVKFGMTKEEARKYAEQVLSIPAARATQISADTSQATRAIKGLFDYWSSKTITLRVAAQQDRVEGRATGGLITGPGTGTSDSIPALLSNGEYVVRAAAVDHYGVEKLHAINAMRFADGGLVGGQRTSVNASVSLPSDGWAITGSLNVGGQLVPLVDARIQQAITSEARAYRRGVR